MARNDSQLAACSSLIVGARSPGCPIAHPLLYGRPAGRSCLGAQSSPAITTKLHTAPLGSHKNRLVRRKIIPGPNRHTLVLGSLTSGLLCLSKPTL